MTVTRNGNWRSLPPAGAVAACVLAATLAGCASSQPAGGSAAEDDATSTTVTVDLTSAGCAPRPDTIAAGSVQFKIANSGAGAVSEAELRTSDLSKILGEQENLTPGLSGGFSLNIQPGEYVLTCPGAKQSHWKLTVTGKASGPAWQSDPRLAAAVRGYASYVEDNTAALVKHTQSFIKAIGAGSMNEARALYPQARIYYERIEPVAETWGSLDTAIDGRWENPVTVAAKFTGFHKIEQLLWRDNTLAGAQQLCAGLIVNEQKLLALVRGAQYSPLQMASGATELINEAATVKITGEEERYSNADFPVFAANVAGAMKVVSLLAPYLQHKDPGLLSLIDQRAAAVSRQLAGYKASPGYDDTGYVDYSTVQDAQRRQLSAAVNALAEALSKLSHRVS